MTERFLYHGSRPTERLEKMLKNGENVVGLVLSRKNIQNCIISLITNFHGENNFFYHLSPTHPCNLSLNCQINQLPTWTNSRISRDSSFGWGKCYLNMVQHASDIPEHWASPKWLPFLSRYFLSIGSESCCKPLI